MKIDCEQSHSIRFSTDKIVLSVIQTHIGMNYNYPELNIKSITFLQLNLESML